MPFSTTRNSVLASRFSFSQAALASRQNAFFQFDCGRTCIMLPAGAVQHVRKFKIEFFAV